MKTRHGALKLIIKRNMGIIGAGRLNELIEIWYLDVKTSEFGDTTESWKFSSNARAMVDHTAGSLNIENFEIFNAYNKSFTVRFHTDVHDTDRIKYNGKFYRIITIDIDRPKQIKIIQTELINE